MTKHSDNSASPESYNSVSPASQPPTPTRALAALSRFYTMNQSPPELFSGVSSWSSLAVTWETWRSGSLDRQCDVVSPYANSIRVLPQSECIEASTNSFTLILIANINSQITHYASHSDCNHLYGYMQGTEWLQGTKEAMEFMEAEADTRQMQTESLQVATWAIKETVRGAAGSSCRDTGLLRQGAGPWRWSIRSDLDRQTAFQVDHIKRWGPSWDKASDVWEFSAYLSFDVHMKCYEHMRMTGHVAGAMDMRVLGVLLCMGPTWGYCMPVSLVHLTSP